LILLEIRIKGGINKNGFFPRAIGDNVTGAAAGSSIGEDEKAG
jgi:hypothetical protein